MSITIEGHSRLGNQIIRNLAVSILAEKHDLLVTYCNYHIIHNLLGIKLFIGKNNYNETMILTDDNYFAVYIQSSIQCNLEPNYYYYQTKDISNFLYLHLRTSEIQENIKSKNPFSSRYQNNNDLCIHFRLGDISHFNPGIEYYIKATKQLPNPPDTIFLCTDEPTHPFITQYIDTFPNTIIVDLLPYKTLQFSSTCKYIILSHGSFSAMIGYLAFYSTIYYPQYQSDKMWYGDMFSIPNWNCIT